MSDTSFRDRVSSDAARPLPDDGSSARRGETFAGSSGSPGPDGGAFARSPGDAEFLKQQRRKITDPMLDAAREMADRQKAAGVEQIGMVARAVHGAASEIESQSPRTAALIHETANSLERASSALSRQSVDQLAETMGSFARKHPAAFFTGTIVAGFALTRFLKSSTDRNEHSAMHGAMEGSAGYEPMESAGGRSPMGAMGRQGPAGAL